MSPPGGEGNVQGIVEFLTDTTEKSYRIIFNFQYWKNIIIFDNTTKKLLASKLLPHYTALRGCTVLSLHGIFGWSTWSGHWKKMLCHPRVTKKIMNKCELRSMTHYPACSCLSPVNRTDRIVKVQGQKETWRGCSATFHLFYWRIIMYVIKLVSLLMGFHDPHDYVS